MSGPARVIVVAGLVGAVTVLSTSVAYGQTLSGDALVKSLRQGGYVLVMRHASSPREVPDNQTANADNVKLERQLDEGGRRGSIAMGQALRSLNFALEKC